MSHQLIPYNPPQGKKQSVPTPEFWWYAKNWWFSTCTFFCMLYNKKPWLLIPMVLLTVFCSFTFVKGLTRPEPKDETKQLLIALLKDKYRMDHPDTTRIATVEAAMPEVKEAMPEEFPLEAFPVSEVDAAPTVLPKPSDKITPQEYIKRYSPVAVAEMKKYGVPASITLAQGIIESRSGNSKLAKEAKNHFGIKCFSKKCKKGHCMNFTDDTHKDFFRKYPNVWESYRAHTIMISSGRYAKLKKNGNNYRLWAYGLKKVGYATDKTYAQKLIGVVQRYNLDKFDSK